MSAPDIRVEAGATLQLYSSRYRWYVVLLLTCVFAVYGANRVLLGVLIEPLKAEFGLSDATLGFIGGTLVSGTFALCIIPFGIFADRTNRQRLLVYVLAAWSLMTIASGFAASVVFLAGAQMLLALHQSAGTPTMNSLISDLFPRAKRGLPSAVWFSGVSVGGLLGAAAGGYVAEQFGWRMAFIALGIPGLLLAPIVWITVRETPRGMADGTTNVRSKSSGLRDTLRYFARQKALRHAGYAMCIASLAFMGPVYWMIAFFQRSHGVSLTQAGSLLGLAGLTGLVGSPLGGFMMDRLGQRDVRWHGRLPAILMVISIVPMMAMYLLPSTTAAFFACVAWQLVTTGVMAINIALINNLAPAQFRSLSMAFAFLLFYLVGFGFGSQLIGLNSDLLAARFGLGRESLRVACLLMVLFYFWAAAHFWTIGRHVKQGYAGAVELEQDAPGAAQPVGAQGTPS